MKKIRNILFIMADQLRWDYLSCYGHLHLKTPNIDNLAKKGVHITVVDARFAKPLDENLIWQLATTHEAIVTIEEGSIGGFGSHVVDYLTKKGLMDSNLKFRSLTLPDIFIDQDTPNKMYKIANLDANAIEDKILDVLNSNIILQKQK